jgi:hypothetical protein
MVHQRYGFNWFLQHRLVPLREVSDWVTVSGGGGKGVAWGGALDGERGAWGGALDGDKLMHSALSYAVAGPPTNLAGTAVRFNILQLTWSLPNQPNGIITGHTVISPALNACFTTCCSCF